MAVAASGVALAAGSGPAVTVQIKSLNKTLLKPTAEHGEKGWITKGGTPHGKCPGASAAGALDAATHGKWAGKYYSSVGGIFVTSIDGVKPAGSDYWERVRQRQVREHWGSATSSSTPGRSCCSRSSSRPAGFDHDVQDCSHGGRDRVRGRDRRLRPGRRQGDLGRRHADRYPGLRHRAGRLGDREEHPRVADRDADARAVVQGHDALQRRVRRVDRRPRRQLHPARLVLLRQRDRGARSARPAPRSTRATGSGGTCTTGAPPIRSRRSSARSPSRSSTASAAGGFPVTLECATDAGAACKRVTSELDCDRGPGREPGDRRRVGNGLARRGRRHLARRPTASCWPS